jgi:hypothetical protein
MALAVAEYESPIAMIWLHMWEKHTVDADGIFLVVIVKWVAYKLIIIFVKYVCIKLVVSFICSSGTIILRLVGSPVCME